MSHRPRSTLRFGVAALTLALLGSAGQSAFADMVLTTDGKWTPLPQGATLPADQEPGDDLLAASAEFRVDAAYDIVKSNRGFSRPAAEVVRIVASDRAGNETYKKALNDASSGFFQDAAEGFLAAANELNGFGKQSALWDRIQAFSEAGAADRIDGAVGELLAAFPKAYYFGDAQIVKAKVAAIQGNVAGAESAVGLVKSAQGMNQRDFFKAEYNRIFLTLETQRKFDVAAADYRKLAVDAGKVDAAIGGVTSQRSMVGLGNCLLATKKETEAKTFFEQATASKDPVVLAGAYAGLGDIGLTEARTLREGGKLKEAKERLEQTLLDYLRVTTLYRASEDTSVLRSLENQARVFIALFEMGGSKECELATRAYSSYVELSRMLPDGPQKSGVVRAAREFDQKREAAGCKPK